MIQNYSFILNDHEFLLPANIDNIEGLPRDIINEILKNCKYQFEMDVKEEIFQEYLNHLCNRNQFPEINLQNIFQFRLLSDRFIILSDYLKQPDLIELYKISVLLNASSTSNHDKSVSEKYISENLDHYLTNHQEEMIQIPVNSLYNIFYSNERVLHNHERAYHFIIQNGKQNQSLFILLRSLDGTKLSRNSLNDSFLEIDKHFGFAPICDFTFIEKANKKVINLLIATIENHPIIDFNFINTLNNENSKFMIKVTKIDINNLIQSIEKNSIFLSNYDILAFGGCDSFANYMKFSKKDYENHVVPFHKNGGVILFMHNFFLSKNVKYFRPLADLLGYVGHPEFTMYNEITFNELCGKNDILKTPFKLNKTIRVGETHQTPRYSKRFTVFYNGDKKTHYYSENIDQNIADIEMGHSLQITNDEKKLFYNIICHLFVKRNKDLASIH